jgi:hypothetical protein
MSTIDVSKFGLDLDLFDAIGDNLDAFKSTSSTRTLTVGKTVQMNGTINGVETPYEVTVESANLTRLSVLKQESPYTGKEYFLVTGILNPVKMNVALIQDGNKISLNDLFYQFVTANGKNVDREAFERTLNDMGFTYNTGMPMYFQQFGASEAGIQHAVDTFKSAGAIDVTGRIENPGRIVAAYAHQGGVPVTSFEVGSVDREKSRTKQGFIDFLDAQVSAFTRAYSLRLKAHMITQQMDGKPQATIAEMSKERDALLQQSRQWIRNWAGSQQRIMVGKGGRLEPQPMYDLVNAPSGRFTLNIDGTEIGCDLWSNSARANDLTIPAAKVNLDEVPF